MNGEVLTNNRGLDVKHMDKVLTGHGGLNVKHEKGSPNRSRRIEYLVW